jgi:hypothetical protein
LCRTECLLGPSVTSLHEESWLVLNGLLVETQDPGSLCQMHLATICLQSNSDGRLNSNFVDNKDLIFSNFEGTTLSESTTVRLFESFCEAKAAPIP